jgi:hypothetical protein
MTTLFLVIIITVPCLRSSGMRARRKLARLLTRSREGFGFDVIALQTAASTMLLVSLEILRNLLGICSIMRRYWREKVERACIDLS